MFHGVDQIYFWDENHGVILNGKDNNNLRPRDNHPIYTNDGGKNWIGTPFNTLQEHFDAPCRFFQITKSKFILTGFRGEFSYSYNALI